MSKHSTQTPIAIIGLACRLPGSCNSPKQLWDFLLDGGVATTDTPQSRLHLQGHYDKTLRPWTMRSRGGMFIDSDPRDLDAGFFGLSQIDAISMDPQQRQLLEVVYEGLENAGLTLEQIKSTPFGCFVGSYASDYNDMQTRDPEDKTPSTTIGSGRAMLSNRISHFLGIQGPSMTIDTACSGSLTAVDLACRYLDSGDADGAIAAGCNIYLSPEHNMDQHSMSNAASPSGKCWTFDARADGYIKAEAVNVLILKRLEDAIRDKDPIRAVIRGTATNSDGRTPGIASPSPEAQALAIQRAYARAGISNLTDTAYLECHGTGTSAGDPMECKAAASVFSKTRQAEKPLRIGSIKSNVGHSEPAAGVSGVIKTVMAIEKGIIPGNPTFEIPNSNIDFEAGKLLPSKNSTPWPVDMIRRASVNSFGYGGANAHVVVEAPQVLCPNFEPRSITSFGNASDDIFSQEDEDQTRRLLVFSANNKASLKAYIRRLIQHLADPRVQIESTDLAYTLSERRTRHFYRAFGIAAGSSLLEANVTYTKPRHAAPRIGLVFTGQGAQWPQMGKELISHFSVAKQMVNRLDTTLQSLSEPPSWKLLDEMTAPRPADHLRQPEFSQPLITALQLALLAVLKDWGIQPSAVVGHSSGEIAAAVTAGALSPETGIVVAYLRGKAAKELEATESNQKKKPLGMLAAGLGPDAVVEYLQEFPRVKLACRNSPNSITLSGQTSDLTALESIFKVNGYFARLLQVNLAYHSDYMDDIALHYQALLNKHCAKDAFHSSKHSQIYSTVHGALFTGPFDVKYWVDNMKSPVVFDYSVSAMVKDGGINCLIELGPSNTLAGPVKQITKAVGDSVDYFPTLARGFDSLKPLYELAGNFYASGIKINLNKVNNICRESQQPKVIIDLPNYQWDHSIQYWYESLSSQDWRYRPFPIHDLLGTKVLGTSWSMPTWKRILRLKDIPWIRDHMLGSDIVFPASGYVTMAIEAIFQADYVNRNINDAILSHDASVVADFAYRLRDVRFLHALTLEEDIDCFLYLFLIRAPGQGGAWHHFRIASNRDKQQWTDHCQGYVQIMSPATSEIAPSVPVVNASSRGRLWYKSMEDIGLNFGPTFQNLSEIDSTPGKRSNTARIRYPTTEFLTKQSSYAIHPTLLDSFFQAGIPSLYQGHRTDIEQVMVPRLIDELTIYSCTNSSSSVIADAKAVYVSGRPDKVQNYASIINIHNEQGSGIIARVNGLHSAGLQTAESLNRSQSFMKTVWKADITLPKDVSLEQFASSSAETADWSRLLRLPPAAAVVVSLLAHKLPSASVLDLDMTHEMHEHLNGYEALPAPGQLSAFNRYVSASSTTEHMLDSQRRWEGYSGVEFHIYDIKYSRETTTFDTSAKFDLVILRLFQMKDEGSLDTTLKAASEFLSTEGLLILTYSCEDPGTGGVESALQFAGLEVLSKSTAAYLCANTTTGKCNLQYQLVDLTSGSPECGILIDNIRSLGWEGKLLDLESTASQACSEGPLLLIDNPESSILSTITTAHFVALQKVIGSHKKLLWVTAGSQMKVSSPTNALVHGFARTVRGEDSLLTFKTVDVSSYASEASARAVLAVAQTLSENSSALHRTEYEYCERDEILHVSRVLPNNELLQTDKALREGAPLEDRWLRSNPKTVRLHCEKTGALDSLHFNEVKVDGLLQDHEVDVEILAAGMNYKDVMTCLGLLQQNEYCLGLEGAGIIKRIGNAVHTVRVGDRVLVHGPGCFSNRNRVREEYVFRLPDSTTFEEAATMSIVYFTVVYALLEVTKLQKGDSLLIHSAAGGVGLASIHVAKYLGLTIYATAGNDEKRKFLQEQHGISAEHIFPSRDTSFVAGIRSVTNGRGVDCVINSLTGSLLDESWRLLSGRGTFIDIGKKDIIDRNTLAMEPFNRNCSYRAIDISQPHLFYDIPLVSRVLQTIKRLLFSGYIYPITPIRKFSFNEVPEAIRYMRPGIHIGKIVIAHGAEHDEKVPTRPLSLEMKIDPKATYLVIGGLKGLCGSLAVYLARCGARNITTVSRSGASDERSQQVVRDLISLGAKVIEARCDISNLDEVLKIFKESTLPIDGVVQGAMVLRDKTFESMTPTEYHQALSCKLQGTWNLHYAEERTGRKLSFFTLLSSISGVIGTASQANYAAGNAFQDAFAAWRCSIGLAAHAVDLGIVDDVGYMSEHAALTRRVQARSQLPGINERKLHDILRLSILQQQKVKLNGNNEQPGANETSSSQMITGLPIPMAADAPLANDMRFIGLLPKSWTGESKGSRGPDDTLRAFEAMLSASLPAEKLVAEAVKLVNAQFVRVLGLSTDMEEAKFLGSYGVDSLAAVDLRNWLKVNLHVELTTLEVLNAASLRALCEKLVGRLLEVKSGNT